MKLSIYIEECTVDQAGALVEAVRDLKKLTANGGGTVHTIAAEAKAEVKAQEPKALTPAVKALAEELHIPASQHGLITGTGKDGNVTQGDVKAFAKGRPPAVPAAVANIESEAGTPAGPAHPDDAAPTLEQVKGALKGLNEVKGMPACIKVLSKAGAANVSALLPAAYADFITACELEAA